MVEIIKKYCDNSNLNSGLLLIDSPTGSGKTHSVMQYICDKVCDNSNTKIFYITSLKKNLPEKDLSNMFSKIGKGKLFDKKFLYINSNVEQVKENWSKVKNQIPTHIREHSTYKNLNSTLNYLNNLPNDLKSNIENQLRTEFEPNFRKHIKSLLQQKFANAKERLNAIKTDSSWKWIGILYPAVFTSERQIFFLSMDKFLRGNSTLIEPTYQFLNHEIIENAIIFIDEFDSTKDTILNKIISDNLHNKINYIQLFNTIYSNLNRNFPKNFIEISKDIMIKVTNMAQIIHKKYNMNYLYKTSNNFPKNNNNFIFHDYKHHNIFNANENNYITLIRDNTENICWIDMVPEKPSLDENNIFNLLSQIKGFIVFFQNTINILAHRYCKQKNSKRESYDIEFTIDKAINSIVELFNIEGEYKNFIINGILSNNNIRNNSISSNIDLSFYEKGFRYYDFIDDENHDFESKIMLSAFSNTPEKVLLNICNKAKVIGISATATLNSVISNYDIDYLKLKLNNRYYSISKEDRLSLQEKFNLLNKGYENVNIHTEFISGDNNYSENSWKNLFNNEEMALAIYNSIELLQCEKIYIKKRYLKIAKAYKEFISHKDIKSFLCMLNKHPLDNDISLDKSILKEIFNYIIEDILGKNSNLSYDSTVIYMQSQNFNLKKDELQARLFNGEKIFVISVYQTIGVGQNLQYNFNQDTNIVKINDRTSLKQKDFDAIYLDKPTNIVVNLLNGITEENFVKYIYQVEFLKYRGEISLSVATNNIRKAFRYFIGEDFSKYSGNLYQCTSVKLAITKIIIQAIGRICRTSYKNSDIYIYADSDLIDILDISTIDNLCNIEYKMLLEKVLANRNASQDNQLENICNRADNVSNVAYKYIMNTLLAYDDWSKEKVARWNTLRDLVLKYPTASKEDYKNNSIISNMYIQLPQKNNCYWYQESNDYQEVKVHFDKKHPNDKEVSLNDIKWNILMDIPNLKEYFIQNNYAIDFTPNDYIMCPVLFNNIYKGALGEIVGKFIFESILGYKLQSLDISVFERFDFYIENGIYVDFKYWKDSFICNDRSTLIDNILAKLKECNGKKVIIVNILSNEENNMETTGTLTGENFEILEVPYLFSIKTRKLNLTALEKIRRFINGNI